MQPLAASQVLHPGQASLMLQGEPQKTCTVRRGGYPKEASCHPTVSPSRALRRQEAWPRGLNQWSYCLDCMVKGLAREQNKPGPVGDRAPSIATARSKQTACCWGMSGLESLKLGVEQMRDFAKHRAAPQTG